MTQENIIAWRRQREDELCGDSVSEGAQKYYGWCRAEHLYVRAFNLFSFSERSPRIREWLRCPPPAATGRLVGDDGVPEQLGEWGGKCDEGEG
jgi:hypothetical protein